MNYYSSGGSRDSTFRPEHDNTKRTAEVYIFLSTLEIMKNTVFESWDNFKHWALIFLFDSRRLKYELNNPSGRKTGGTIQPSWDDFHGVRENISNPNPGVLTPVDRRGVRSLSSLNRTETSKFPQNVLRFLVFYNKFSKLTVKNASQ